MSAVRRMGGVFRGIGLKGSKVFVSAFSDYEFVAIEDDLEKKGENEYTVVADGCSVASAF